MEIGIEEGAAMLREHIVKGGGRDKDHALRLGVSAGSLSEFKAGKRPLTRPMCAELGLARVMGGDQWVMGGTQFMRGRKVVGYRKLR